MTLIKSFSELDKTQNSVAGGKGASLAEMINAGIPVPKGFVVLANTFDSFLKEENLDQKINELLKKVDLKEQKSIDLASKKIQSIIIKSKIPKKVEKIIIDNFDTLNSKYVAVRSSATSEDSASAAWAGQLESYLNTTKKDLLINIKKCWASLFSPRAIFYRFEKGLAKKVISVAVVVQKMIDSESSGVAFSVHPVTQDKNQIIIEAGFGLGEAIVQGIITPDSYIVDKKDNKILDIKINSKDKAMYRDDKAGNKWVNLKELGKKQVLNEKEILELSNLIIKIENHYGFPVDIEWAKENNKFYIVQSRPITTLNKEINIEQEKIKKIESNEIVFDWWLSRPYPLLQIQTYNNYLGSIAREVNFPVTKPIFVYEPDKKLVRLYYNMKELMPAIGHIGKTFIEKLEFRKKIYSELIDVFNKIKKYFDGEISINSFKEFESFFELFTDYMRLIAYIWVIPGLDFVPQNIKDEAMDLRKKTENYAGRRDSIMIKFAQELINTPEINSSFLTLNEIKQKPKNMKELTEQRSEGFLFYNEKIVLKKDIPAFMNENNFKLREPEVLDKNKVQGTVAQVGIVRGKARIIYVEEDLYKIKDSGDIIVTPMTRPEFVPFMKKAGAFVTDEGGVICHAAIVSRELNKPCIVGTKVATKVFHDGDEIEVDAERGIVTLLKTNKEKKDLFELEFTRETSLSSFYLWLKGYLEACKIIGLDSRLPNKVFGVYEKGVIRAYTQKNNILIMKEAINKLSNLELNKILEEYYRNYTSLKNNKEKKDINFFEKLVAGFVINFILGDILENKLQNKALELRKKTEDLFLLVPNNIYINLKEHNNCIINSETIIPIKNNAELNKFLDQESINLLEQEIKLSKLFTRERSLFLNYIEFLSSLKSKSTIEGIENFIYINQNKITTYWYDLGEINEVITKFISTMNKDILNNVTNRFEFYWSKVSAYLKDEKKIESFAELKAFNKNYLAFLNYQKIINQSNEVSQFPEEYSEKCRILREQTQSYVNKLDYIIKDFIKLKFEKYKDLAFFISPEELFSLENKELSSEQINKIKERKEKGYVIYNGQILEYSSLNNILQRNHLKLDIQEDKENNDYTELTNTQTREHSLFYAHVWNDANKNHFDKYIPNTNIKNMVFLLNKKGVLEVYYNPKELSEVSNRISEAITKDPKILDKIIKEFYKYWKKLLPYLSEKGKIKNNVELKECYKNWVFWWAPMAYIFVIPDNKNTPLELRNKALKVREENQKYSDEGDKILRNYIDCCYPKYSPIFNLFTPEEAFRLDSLSNSEIENIKSRANGCALATVNSKTNLLSLEDLDKELANSNTKLQGHDIKTKNEIKGVSASVGKAKGKVRLILTKAALKNIKKGDVMVTYATSPDYVPAMKKCSAIITDEGGVVCHAAIVSRELGIPCIIGTKIATQVLKDGDLVEVDANEGRIKILDNNIRTYKELGHVSAALAAAQLSSHGESLQNLPWSKEKFNFSPYCVFEKKGELIYYLYDPEGSAWKMEQAGKFDKEILKEKVMNYYKQIEKIIINERTLNRNELKGFIEKIKKGWTWWDCMWWMIEYYDKNKLEMQDLLELRKKTEYLIPGIVAVVEKSIKNIVPSKKKFAKELLIEEVLNNKIPSDKELEKRKKECVFTNGKLYNYLREVEEEFNIKIEETRIDVKKLSGQTAYPGFVKGTVRIVRNRKDVLNFKSGEIIVSSTTTPDFLPAMKKAAAIISEHGGAICHASITSRELKIPCVVGIKGITKVLINGDLVEVDANKGIITKL